MTIDIGDYSTLGPSKKNFSSSSLVNFKLVMSDYPELSAPSLPRTIEKKLYTQHKPSKSHYVIGVDEAGRGPLAGPVVAAAFAIVAPRRDLPGSLSTGVTDSKQVKEEAREAMYTERFQSNGEIMYRWSVIDNKTIDKVNILQATFLAMTESATQLMDSIRAIDSNATFSILIDGNKIPPQLQQLAPSVYSQFVIKGDSLEFVIAAASICAKVERDSIMHALHASYPQYGFAQHKGYPTSSHVAAIREHGPCKYHRMTFAPLKHMKKTKRGVSATSKTTVAAVEKIEDARAERLRRRTETRSTGA
jgi:ribonuclease HII